MKQSRDSDNQQTDVATLEEEVQPKLKYPRSIPFIVVNEFCERFNFYGMKTILVLYLTRKLFYDDDTSTVIYHTFTMLVYFMCIFGAIVADSWLGRFKTIVYLSIVYTIGSVLIAIGAIELLGLPAREFTLIGLFVIAVGSGGIKPCVAAFGGEQFKLPEQVKQLAVFFSIFYFSVNAGSLISTSITPILREDVKCFGMNDCFPLAFGVPAVLMITATIVFIAGKFMYVINPLSGNMLVRVCSCIWTALTAGSREKNTNPKDYWLEHAEEKHGRKLVLETKILLNILVLYIPLPLFWALFDQQGSRWTFQATRMNGDIGFMDIKPDQMQVINPFLILVLIPLYTVLFYPLLSKIGIRRPLQKLTLGGTLAGVAFIISAIVEITLEQGYAVLPVQGQTQLRIFNGASCSYTFENSQHSFTIDAFDKFEDRYVRIDDDKFKEPFDIKSDPNKSCLNFTEKFKFELESQTAVSYVLREIDSELKMERFIDDPNKSRTGKPVVRILASTLSKEENITIRTNDQVVYNNSRLFLNRTEIPSGDSKIFVGDKMVHEEKFKLGGVYAVVIYEYAFSKFDTTIHAITEPNSISILWQIPQYLVLTLGEVMFSVTGLEFSFTQAPESMKSVIMGSFNLTVAVGNLIVILITSLKFFDSQAYEFFLFAGLMFVDMAAFSWLAYRYKPIPLESLNDVDDSDSQEDKMLDEKFANKGFINNE